jgi:hypothetical protein
MTNGSDNSSIDAATALSPQEWKWYLQDQDLIPRNVYLKLEPLKEEGAVISLLSLSATIVNDYQNTDETQNVSTQVAQGLSWLQKASMYDLKLLQTALQEAQTQRIVLDKRLKLLTANVARQESTHRVPSSDATTVERNSFLKEEMSALLSRHGNSLAKVMTHYQHICERTHQPCGHVETLQTFVSQHDMENTLGTTIVLENEVQGLLAFYQARQSECGLSNKQSIPPFMTLTTNDDIELLIANIGVLQQACKDFQTTRYKSCQAENRNSMPLQQLKEHRMEFSRKCTEDTAKRLSELTTKIETLQQNISWCRERINQVKTTVERDIAILLGHDKESLVRIQL